MVDAWTKAERLAIAGAIAPTIRSAEVSKRDRIVRIKDKNGNTIRTLSLIDLQKELLEKRGIEIDMGDGIRPKITICEDCGCPIFVKKSGVLRTRCDDCGWVKCENCNKRVSMRIASNDIRKSKITRWCKPCSVLLGRRKTKPTSPEALCVSCGERQASSVVSYHKKKHPEKPLICKRCCLQKKFNHH